MKSERASRRLTRALFVICVLLAVPAAAGPPLARHLSEKIESAGSVRVIVGLEVRRGVDEAPGLSGESRYRDRIAALQQSVLAAMPVTLGMNAESVKTFDFIPFMALEVDAAGLQYLQNAPPVVSIEEDVPVPPNLTQSTPLIRATNAWAAGYTGSGRTVAILDTGVDKTHSFLSGKVVSEACYSTTGTGTASLCPGGASSSTATGSGVNCTGLSGCDHGTHVAGTAAGSGASFSGVAKGASVIAMQVFTRFNDAASCSPSSAPCVRTYSSDRILALQRVYALRNTYAIDAVNMSLGGGQFTSQSSCDSAYSGEKAAIDTLRSVGIATVISSGNDYYKTAMGAPGCISTAISVGSTIDSGTSVDTVSAFSNSASFLNLLAPGQVINASVPGGSFSNFQGTSMAAPHVTGAVAVLRQKCPSATVADVLTALSTTGVSVTDTNGITKPRINVEAALAALCGAGGAACGLSGATATVSGPATEAAPLPGGSALRPPSVRGLPAGGVWQREARKGGETWTYTFDIDPAQASTANAAAPTSESGTLRTDPGRMFAIPALGNIGPRSATADEQRQFADAGSAEQLAGTDARGGGASTLAGATPRIARLAAPAVARGVSVFDITFDEVPAGAAISSARLFLNVKRPAAGPLKVWLVTADRRLLVWEGSAESVVVDRILSEELRGVSPSSPLTIALSGADGATLTVEEAWMLVTLGDVPKTTDAENPQATLDVYAYWASLRTASAVGGSEVTTPAVGQSVYFHVDYQVNGSGNSVWLNHRATIDGSLFCSFDASATPGYYYTGWCGSAWNATAGSHTLRWDLDYYNTVSETNESNNAVTKSFTPSGGVDVAADRAYMRTASGAGGSEVSTPAAGQSVYFHVDYYVNGSGSPFNLNHRATIDGSLFCSFDASATPGYYYTGWCGSPWTATAGTHTLRWDLDYYNTVAETSESNNAASRTFTTSGADVQATRAFMRTAAAQGGSEIAAPTAGQPVYFHVDYQVAGSGSAFTLSHRAVIDGSTHCSFDASATPGNAYTGWCNGAWTVTAGSHTLRWDLDYNNTVIESNESNNSATAGFTAASGIDLAAQRAFMKTAPNNGGSEVAQPAIGQNVYFHSALQVNGSGSPVTVSMRALLDGSVFCSCSLSATPGSSYVASCSNAWSATAGQHTLTWEFDHTGSISESNEGNNNASATFTVAAPPLPPPPNLVASAVSTAQVNLTWGGVSGASSYEVYRSSGGAAFQFAGVTSSLSFSDTSRAANTTYVYKVRALDSANAPGTFSLPDLATTILFTNDPLVVGSTRIRAVHFTELRTAVNAVRAAAGLAPLTFGTSIVPGVIVRASHVTELRTGLDVARSVIGVPAISYTNPGNVIIRAVHLADLRTGVK